MAREFLHLGAAENSLELIFGDRKIGAGPSQDWTWALSPPFCSAATRPLRSRYCVLASTALIAAGSAVASTVPRAPLSAPPRSRPSNKPMVASSTRLNAPA